MVQTEGTKLIVERAKEAVELAQCLEAYLIKQSEGFDFAEYEKIQKLMQKLTLAAQLLGARNPNAEVEKLLKEAELIVGYVKSER